MNLSSMKYIKLKNNKNNYFKVCQDFEDTSKIRCLCQNGSQHNKNFKIIMKIITIVCELYQFEFLFMASEVKFDLGGQRSVLKRLRI